MDNIFGIRLKELRNKKQITQKQFAEILGIKERQYQNYEMGTSYPNYKVLINIAQHLDVSLDYLCGRSDTK